MAFVDQSDDEQHAGAVLPLPSFVPGHAHRLSDASRETVDIEAWTVSALQALSVSPIARGTGTPLSIPLDEHHGPAVHGGEMKLRSVAVVDDAVGAAITPPRRPPSRRDSMKRRDALLKGKEGSRQRRRWENDRLMHVPNVEPPQPIDWQVHPTHPVNHVPYHVAQFWDKGVRERAEQRKAALATHRKKGQQPVQAQTKGLATRAEVGKVPKELHTRAKRTPAVRLWLRGLEVPVRQFLVEQGAVAQPESEEEMDDDDDDDDEIVFVGRNGSMHDGAKRWKKASRQVPNQPPEVGMVMEAPGDDESAGFKRWLTHSISDYYGLDSRSVDVGKPARRAVYVCIKKTSHAPALPIFTQLPPPLWEIF